jgi:hypothetical protein
MTLFQNCVSLWSLEGKGSLRQNAFALPPICQLRRFLTGRREAAAATSAATSVSFLILGRGSGGRRGKKGLVGASCARRGRRRRRRSSPRRSPSVGDRRGRCCRAPPAFGAAVYPWRGGASADSPLLFLNTSEGPVAASAAAAAADCSDSRVRPLGHSFHILFFLGPIEGGRMFLSSSFLCLLGRFPL